MSPECQDLIIKCLDPDHTTRLGAKGSEDVKKHPFFKGVDWKKIKKQPAPIQPEIIPPKGAKKIPVNCIEAANSDPSNEFKTTSISELLVVVV